MKNPLENTPLIRLDKLLHLPDVKISFKQEEDMTIVVTHIYCVKGHDLVRPGGPKFEGYDGITFWLEGQHGSGEVIVSPFHGDPRKYGGDDFEPGERLTICCPECKEPFSPIAKCGCSPDGELIALYLTRDLDPQRMVAVCNKWGCLRSRVIDGGQIMIRRKDSQPPDPKE